MSPISQLVFHDTFKVNREYEALGGGSTHFTISAAPEGWLVKIKTTAGELTETTYPYEQYDKAERFCNDWQAQQLAKELPWSRGVEVVAGETFTVANYTFPDKKTQYKIHQKESEEKCTGRVLRFEAGKLVKFDEISEHGNFAAAEAYFLELSRSALTA